MAKTIYSDGNRPPSHPVYVWGESRTKQSEKKSTDINVLMAKYRKTGVIPQNMRPQLFADVSQVGDYREALERVQLADTAFMRLPAKLRSRFANDPAAFLDFCSDPGNRAEMQELGLIEAPGELQAEAPAEAPPE